MKKKSKKTSKICTVNVVEVVEGDLSGVTAFKDDPAGNREAEKLFAKMIIENGAESVSEVEHWIEDGYFESDHGGYKAYITHAI